MADCDILCLHICILDRLLGRPPSGQDFHASWACLSIPVCDGCRSLLSCIISDKWYVREVESCPDAEGVSFLAVRARLLRGFARCHERI